MKLFLVRVEACLLEHKLACESTICGCKRWELNCTYSFYWIVCSPPVSAFTSIDSQTFILSNMVTAAVLGNTNELELIFDFMLSGVSSQDSASYRLTWLFLLLISLLYVLTWFSLKLFFLTKAELDEKRLLSIGSSAIKYFELLISDPNFYLCEIYLFSFFKLLLLLMFEIDELFLSIKSFI